jgi:predicted HicB family RNase H-like nuclease
MSGVLQYKGYVGSVKFSSEDRVFYGKLEGLRDLVSYEGTDVNSLERSFREAVDDYVATCSQRGKTPEIPFKGSFNVRVGKELHMRAATYAINADRKLNTVVSEALQYYLEAKQGITKPKRKSQAPESSRRRLPKQLQAIDNAEWQPTISN